MGPQSLLPMIRLTEFLPSDATSVPMSVRHAAVLEKTLRSALESYKFQFNSMTAVFIISGDSGQIPLELWPSSRHEEDVFPRCHMTPPVPTDRKRNLLSDPVFHQEDLFAPATLDAARHAAGDVSLS